MVNTNIETGDSGATRGYLVGSSKLLVVALYDKTLRLTFYTEKKYVN